MRFPAGVRAEAASGARMSFTNKRQFRVGSTSAALAGGIIGACMWAGPKSMKLRSRNQSGVRMMAEELRKSRRRQPLFRTSYAVIDSK